MKCPFCRSTETEVYNSRSTRFQAQIWRRRRCGQCHEAFTTYEAPDLGFLNITKRSGRNQRYSRAKLYASLYAALSQVSSRQSTVDAVTDTVEAKLLDQQKTELASSEVARVVLVTLKHFNTAAFLRYLSFQTELGTDSQLKKELKKY